MNPVAFESNLFFRNNERQQFQNSLLYKIQKQISQINRDHFFVQDVHSTIIPNQYCDLFQHALHNQANLIRILKKFKKIKEP